MIYNLICVLLTALFVSQSISDDNHGNKMLAFYVQVHLNVSLRWTHIYKTNVHVSTRFTVSIRGPQRMIYYVFAEQLTVSLQPNHQDKMLAFNIFKPLLRWHTLYVGFMFHIWMSTKCEPRFLARSRDISSHFLATKTRYFKLKPDVFLSLVCLLSVVC